jgi:DNA-3-methyladenine glycosylase II
MEDRHEVFRFLCEVDTKLATVIDRIGPYEPKPDQTPFAALVHSIISQQLSKLAADTIRQRLRNLCHGRMPDALGLLSLGVDALASLGMSGRKASYLHGLAERVEGGTLDLDALRSAPDEEVYERLLTVKGIGRWTVDMFLIFTLNRPDVFPISDAALLASMRDIYSLPGCRDERRFMRIGNRWRPYRSYACWYLYAHLDEGRARKRSAMARSAA